MGNPRSAEEFHFLWSSLSRRGDFTAALQAIKQAVQLKPNDAAMLRSLGTSLSDTGSYQEAEDAYREALLIQPNFADAYFDLGYLLYKQDRPADAEPCFRRAAQLAPSDALTHDFLGKALLALGHLKQAESSFRHALSLQPHSPHAHSNLGTALHALGRQREAVESYRKALHLDASLAAAHAGLGAVLINLGAAEESIKENRRALELDRSLISAHSNLIFALDLLPESGTKEQQDERRHWYEAHGSKLATEIQEHRNPPDPERKLRIGYVSADFRRHSAYYVFSGVLLRHDPAAFEVFCYSNTAIEDEATARLRGGVHAWRNVSGMPDAELAAQICRDEIDILVDLSGHSRGHRLLVFARKPAPIQVTAWGHATGTGLATMDYLFSDTMLIPQRERSLYAEEIFDLPAGLCYEPYEALPPVSPLPTAGGEPFTFGCLNRIEKITDRVISLWGRILEQASNARLLVKGEALSDPNTAQNFMRRLEAVDIAPRRVELLGATSQTEQLKVFSRVDVGLDPFPQGGGVSTAETLCMGVPVVTLLGGTFPSRITADVLQMIGLQDWIARSEEDYIRIALAARENINGLSRLRGELRGRLLRSPYGDMESYTKAVESAYRTMWKRWCEKG